MATYNSEDKKTMEEYISKINDYPPPIPESVMKHILQEVGINTDNLAVSHTMNVACQKFFYDVLKQSGAIAKNRGKEDKGKKKKVEIQACDVKVALDYYGIKVDRPDFILSNNNESEEN